MTSDPAAKDGRGHTPAPWRVHTSGSIYAGASYVATTVGEAEKADRDAQRIVACVNACDGIADPEAFIGASRGDIADRMTADNARLRERVKELAQCLVAVLDQVDYRAGLDSDIIRKARILLSKSPK